MALVVVLDMALVIALDIALARALAKTLYKELIQFISLQVFKRSIAFLTYIYFLRDKSKQRFREILTSSMPIVRANRRLQKRFEANKKNNERAEKFC